MRLQDTAVLPEAECFHELQSMKRYKTVVHRQGVDAQGQPTQEWRFRHDKILGFFIVQTFFRGENERPLTHLGDPRVRDVYFLLAMFLLSKRRRRCANVDQLRRGYPRPYGER